MTEERTAKNSAASCCGEQTSQLQTLAPMHPQALTTPDLPAPTGSWINGTVETAVGPIPLVATRLDSSDRLGGWRSRWGFGRMRYTVTPGLYAIGKPTPESPVLVSANYKLSFDHLRCRLTGLSAWILVLDTRGINVWCAAGKGTFGTTELVNRIAAVRLAEVVSHRRLIVPQLGAPGVSAHEVKAQSDFKVRFGPVRADDLLEYLDNGQIATPRMRRVSFNFRDRMVLIPVEIMLIAKITLAVSVGLILLSGLSSSGYSLASIATTGLMSVIILMVTTLVGTILIPALLPWLPGRAFAVKGLWIGIAGVLALGWYHNGHPEMFSSRLEAWAWLFFIPATTSFMGMNFTGSSTYTSLSGVLKEMKVAVPLQIGFTVIALGLWITGLFVK